MAEIDQAQFDNFIKATAEKSKNEPKRDTTTRITFTLKQSILDKVDKYAEASKQSRSEAIAELIQDGINYKLNSRG